MDYELPDEDGLTSSELSAYLRQLASLEADDGGATGTTWERAFIGGRISALLSLAELVERREIRAGLFSEPIHRLHTVHPSTGRASPMPDD